MNTAITITSEELTQEFERKKRMVNDENGLPALTHYLHNAQTGNAENFKKYAIKYLKEYLTAKYPEEKISSSITESALKNLETALSKSSIKEKSKTDFTFIDLFAGIGGFRVAMQNLGGKCVFTSEWDASAKRSYYYNYGEVPFGDITKEETKKFIPQSFDILCAGFPCQAFSIAGRRGGFNDTRGTLFFDVAEIIKTRKPKAIFLENVKGLVNHKSGVTLATILNVLRNDLDYFVPEPEIINAKNFGVPQNRERIFIVGFRKDLGIKAFKYPEKSNKKVVFKNVKEEKVVSTKYYLSNRYLQTLINHKQRHADKGNGFGYEIIPDDGIANAIVVGGMGRERNLVIDKRITDYTPVTKIKGEVNKQGIRKMTPREWARLQGFPEQFKIVVADVSAYKQFGNSVAVPAIQANANEMIKLLFKKK
jgi:DNA (cytosine-5)-methyltransferase 1